jgi:hypothetical protein
MACAINSLPVPVSPVMRTVQSVPATTAAERSIFFRQALLPIISGKRLSVSSSSLAEDASRSSFARKAAIS